MHHSLSFSRYLVPLLIVLGMQSVAQADVNSDRTVALYKKASFDNLGAGEATTAFSNAGVPSTYNPKTAGNPDPAWIPGWNQLALTDETKTAILQAAVNRTWTARIHAEYDRFRKAWTAIENEYRPVLESAKQGTYYARATVLRKLLVDVTAKAESQHIRRIGKPYMYVGFEYEIIAAIVELHRETKREVLAQELLRAHEIELTDVRATARPFATDTIERVLYTAWAQQDGTPTTPNLPRLTEHGKAFAAVRWPNADTKQARNEQAKLVEAGAATLTIETPSQVPSLYAGSASGLHWGGETPNDFSPVVVAKVSGKTIELTTTATERLQYGCKVNPLNRMETYDCKMKLNKTAHTYQIAFEELPDGVTLQKGDRLTFYAEVTARNATKSKRTCKAVGRSLVSVKRNNALIWQWPGKV